MLNVSQFRERVVRPVLEGLALWSEAAENLLLGTAAQESNFTHLVQIKGPALGLYQMEPATHDDIWANYLRYRPAMKSKVTVLIVPRAQRHEQLIWNLAYATAMCRVHYLRVPKPLPDAEDIEGLGKYWKAHYNTSKGKGTVKEFVRNYNRYLV